MIQNKVNISQAFGVPGDFFDLSPKRVLPVIARAKNTSAASATATVTFADEPSIGDSVTVGDFTYTFAAVPASVTAAALELVGALVLDQWTATSVAGVATITAKAAGDAGNLTEISVDGDDITFTAFAGGIDAVTTLPAIGRVFTLTSQPANGPLPAAGVPEAAVGGTGAFLGISVNNKDRANIVGNLTPTQDIPDGSTVGVCSMGRVIVDVIGANVSIGWLPTYNTTTGQISGVASGSAPSGFALIPNAGFVANGGVAGRYAVIELNHA